MNKIVQKENKVPIIQLKGGNAVEVLKWDRVSGQLDLKWVQYNNLRNPEGQSPVQLVVQVEDVFRAPKCTVTVKDIGTPFPVTNYEAAMLAKDALKRAEELADLHGVRFAGLKNAVCNYNPHESWSNAGSHV